MKITVNRVVLNQLLAKYNYRFSVSEVDKEYKIKFYDIDHNVLEVVYISKKEYEKV